MVEDNWRGKALTRSVETTPSRPRSVNLGQLTWVDQLPQVDRPSFRAVLARSTSLDCVSLTVDIPPYAIFGVIWRKMCFMHIFPSYQAKL